ncbi:hypothetical protein ACAW74_26000 [Fibrella sp. WM1]|uniref:hypothetical protein n=1 Tax=Fibrella musci TaxID=3242485 RepID=UPI00351FF273
MSPIPVTIYNGERYVWSDDLYSKLELSPNNYANNLKAWFDREYLFQGKRTFTKPVYLFDYILATDAQAKGPESEPQSLGDLLNRNGFAHASKKAPAGEPKSGRPKEKYLIRFEFAKLIAIDSNSKFKKEFVHWLLSLEARYENNQLLSQSTLLGLMEMVKLCTYIDNQIDFYNTNKTLYFADKEEDDRRDAFDKWRNSIMDLLNNKDLTERFIKVKNYKPSSKMTKVEKLAILDSLESIRVSLFDFLSQQLSPYTDYNLTKARDLADFVKKMFETAGFNQIDIKPRGYSPNGQMDFFRELQEIDVKLISQTVRQLQPYA